MTRGLAYAAKGQVDDAVKEQAAFRAAVAKIPPDAKMAINKAHNVMAIADHVLEGEIALARGQIEESVRNLREAARLEDDLTYIEPPDWLLPARHTLGAVLVSAKRFEEAEKAYREDLAKWPENGWSLFGLAQCLEALGKKDEAATVRKRFDKVWANADTKLTSTCLCVD
jgi:tetratricopeptide (TPR) repeat protein